MCYWYIAFYHKSFKKIWLPIPNLEEERSKNMSNLCHNNLSSFKIKFRFCEIELPNRARCYRTVFIGKNKGKKGRSSLIFTKFQSSVQISFNLSFCLLFNSYRRSFGVTNSEVYWQEFMNLFIFCPWQKVDRKLWYSCREEIMIPLDRKLQCSLTRRHDNLWKEVKKSLDRKLWYSLTRRDTILDKNLWHFFMTLSYVTCVKLW